MLDDPSKVEAELQIIVKYANTLHVKLVAKGVGTTVVFPEWFSKIGILKIIYYSCTDFNVPLYMGTRPTNSFCSRVVTLTNKGRNPQYLEWHNDKVKRGRRSAIESQEDKYPRIETYTYILFDVTSRTYST